MRTELIETIKICNDYCNLLEKATQQDKDNFVEALLKLLPVIYIKFLELQDDNGSFADLGFLKSYIEETQYDSIREGIARLMGEDDTYLETFEEDMKYSDSPIGASISESLADIYQPLYNFGANVRESEGELAEAAFSECREFFKEYWSQTLCNVMRPLNNIKFR